MHSALLPDHPVGSPARAQEVFARVAPLLAASLVLGAAGGFVLATVLTTTAALHVPAGLWWLAVAQAHGHLQLYGWAGLFVLGVAFHFLPRLRGAPLAYPRLVPWLLAALVAALLLRSVCQPLAAVSAAPILRGGLVASGALELVAIALALLILVTTAREGPPLAGRTALWSVLPFFAGAFASLGLAAVVNAANMVAAAGAVTVLVPASGDTLNVTLGLLGFLVPMALAMSARSLPMYAGLDAFPKRLLWPLAFVYFSGLLLALVGSAAGAWAGAWAGRLTGAGLVVIGGVLCVFVAAFIHLMAGRSRLPRRVSALAPRPEAAARAYREHVANERAAYGPYVALVGSAYTWAVLGGVLLLVDGVAMLAGGSPPVTLDAPRHSLALGFIALLICGIAPRMVPGFSGGRIASPALVRATFWLGNCAVLLRVGSLLLAPLLASAGATALDTALFGLSGPFGLALALCLAVNLWPALRPATPRASSAA
jgi:uncharacterized protein involved in response to NO